jgi:hypothetical protein
MVTSLQRQRFLENLGVKALRRLANGMPYRSEASKGELITWLLTYYVDEVDRAIEEAR